MIRNKVIGIAPPHPYFFSALFKLLAFALPMAYLGTILAVAVHEIIGHGLGAVIAGGKMTGFVLRPDGFGSVLLEIPSTIGVTGKVIYLLAGPFMTFIVGTILAGAARRARRRYFLSLGLLILAANLLLEGPPYIFWNAYLPIPPGDVGKIFEIFHPQGLRILLLMFGGFVTLTSIIFLNIALWKMMERWLGNGASLHGWRRLLIFIILAAAQAGSWFIFDWNLIAPGLGVLPNIVGIILTILVLAWMWLRAPNGTIQPAQGGTALPITVAWLSLITVFVLTISWFRAGVHW